MTYQRHLIYLNLDLQLLCRSTFIQLIPTMKDGSLFIKKLSSTSVVAKHEFKSVFIYNVTQHNVRIPKLYSLFTIEGLTYFPSNSGKILELKNLTSIVDLPSQERIFTPQDSQLYSDSEGCFLITCQNFLMSSYLQEHGSSVNTRSSLIPFKAFPFHDIKCRDTRLNTKFNYTNTEINLQSFYRSHPIWIVRQELAVY